MASLRGLPGSRPCFRLDTLRRGSSVECGDQALIHSRNGTRQKGPVACRASSLDTSYPAPKRSSETKNKSLVETLEIDQEEMEDVLSLELQSSLDAPPRHYEFMFLVGEKSAEEIPQVLQKVKDQIGEMRGKIHRLNDWGMRPLAYKIKKQKQANYFLLNVEMSAEKVNALNTFFQKEERVIRHLMTKQDAAETRDYPAPVLFNSPMAEGENEFEDEEEEEEEGEGEEEEEGEWEEGEEEEEEEEGKGRTQASVDVQSRPAVPAGSRR